MMQRRVINCICIHQDRQFNNHSNNQRQTATQGLRYFYFSERVHGGMNIGAYIGHSTVNSICLCHRSFTSLKLFLFFLFVACLFVVNVGKRID